MGSCSHPGTGRTDTAQTHLQSDAPLVGVLAYQGDFRDHIRLLESLQMRTRSVRSVEDLEDCAGLVIPGGESTTIGKLLQRFGVGDRVQQLAAEGFPILGTCAGCILLAQTIEGSDQYRLGLLDISVQRNAYGRQVDSFEAELPLRGDESATTRGVFIRAPRITSIGHRIEVLATIDGAPAAVSYENLVAATFHPELGGASWLHKLFLERVATYHDRLRH